MSTPLAIAPTELMRKHITVLQDYAQRVFIDGHSLTVEEDRDRMRQVAKFRAIGSSLKLTDKEMVKLMLARVSKKMTRCSCQTCRIVSRDF